MNMTFRCKCGANLKLHIAEVPKKLESRIAKCPVCFEKYKLKGDFNFHIKVTLFTEDGQAVIGR